MFLLESQSHFIRFHYFSGSVTQLVLQQPLWIRGRLQFFDGPLMEDLGC